MTSREFQTAQEMIGRSIRLQLRLAARLVKDGKVRAASDLADRAATLLRWSANGDSVSIADWWERLPLDERHTLSLES